LFFRFKRGEVYPEANIEIYFFMFYIQNGIRCIGCRSIQTGNSFFAFGCAEEDWSRRCDPGIRCTGCLSSPDSAHAGVSLSGPKEKASLRWPYLFGAQKRIGHAGATPASVAPDALRVLSRSTQVLRFLGKEKASLRWLYLVVGAQKRTR
jgi:hypothetical protein